MGRTSNDYAEAVLKFLTEGDDPYLESNTRHNPKGKWASTQNILNGTNTPTTSRDTLLSVLERLSRTGAIKKASMKSSNGKGQGYCFTSLITSWNKVNPLTQKHPGALSDEEIEKIKIKEEDSEDSEEYTEFVPQGTGIKAQTSSSGHHLEPVVKGLVKDMQSVNNVIKELVNQKTELLKICSELQSSIKDLKMQSEATPKKIIVTRYESKPKELDGKYILPPDFEKIKNLAECRKPILLVGPAGCGKTTTCKILSEVMGLPFGTIGGSEATSELHFFGRSVPNVSTGKSEFMTTEFLERFEKGGVFVFDEIDAMNGNVLLSLNSAIANGYCPVPHRDKKKMATRHKDFIPIATANTFGKGANRVYSGRNQLDESTLSRFRIGMIEVGYDQNLESVLCPEEQLRKVLWAIRADIEKHSLRRVMDTRFIEDAYQLFSATKRSIKTILETYLQGWTADEKAKLSVIKQKS